MDSKEKGFDTIDLSDLSFSESATVSLGSGSYSMEPLTISSISLSDTMSGPVYSISGNGGSNVIGAVGSAYSNTAWTTNTAGIDWSVGTNIRPSGTIQLTGEDADIRINDKSLMKTLEAIEQRLALLEPNPEMEAEWDELRELGKRYRELEQKCQEKSKMWNKLKQMPPPEVK